MKMNSSTLGIRTSEPEVTHVSSHDIRLLQDRRENFMANLDVDVGIDTIESPEAFPLLAE